MLAQGRNGLGNSAYERHQPEQTLLYQLVDAHYPALVDQLAPTHALSLHQVRKGLQLILQVRSGFGLRGPDAGVTGKPACSLDEFAQTWKVAS